MEVEKEGQSDSEEDSGDEKPAMSIALAGLNKKKEEEDLKTPVGAEAQTPAVEAQALAAVEEETEPNRVPKVVVHVEAVLSLL